MKSLYLVDASNMFFRAFFAIPPLTNDKGMPTNALYGFLAMSLKLIREVKPDYLVYCFDRKEPSFRDQLYGEYKANREEMPENLVPQIPYLRKLTELLGIMHLDKEGFEADDVIGTLTARAVQEHVQAVIVSGDKDFAQLVRPGVSLYDTMKDLRTDSDGVMAKFGVRPDQIIDYLALVGDSSDNVPGVRGIGPKGACKLLTEYQTLDGIYGHIDEIKGANQKKLIEHKDMAFMSRKLCTIVTDVPLDLKLDDLKMKPLAREALRATLQELGFGSFERKIFADHAAATSGAETTVVPSSPVTGTVLGKAAAKKPKGKPSAGEIAEPDEWTEETWTLEELRSRVAPYSEIWAILNERGLFLGVKGKVARVPSDDLEIGKVLGPKHLRWKGYDLKQVFKALRIPLPIPIWDGMLAAYVERANSIPPFEETFEKYCGKKLPDLCTAADQMTAHQELEILLRSKMIEHEGIGVYDRFELPLIPVLTDMELKGVRLDTEELKEQNRTLTADLQRLEQAIYKEAGETFNIGSPKQLGHVLFEKMKLPVGHRTKTGYSTDGDVLEGLAKEHAIARLILEYREFAKLKSTYVDALPVLINPLDGRVHTSLNQASTTTGRLSSTNPNLQNIPIRTARGRLVRKAFIADPGCVLISADYSQIELRVLAHITEDPGLMRAFNEDLDIHAATASEVFGIPLDKVSPENRRVAKAVNFGIAYGQGAFGLSEVLGISRGEATDIINRYFTRFAGVKQYMENTVRQAMERGYVSTLFGRRRYLDEMSSKNPNIRRSGERAAINAPIQGTASDLVKLAMIQLHQKMPIPLLLQVHDELIFEAPEDEAEDYAKDIRRQMENVFTLKVPLKVNVGIGKNWDDAH
ncbi:MAG TPA: DNA polymerase I [Bdellovibrionales bacterium]|nr:DNA polymerase I [Bdellovibrionales bacterium]